jgi:hypothetical protein
MHWDKAMAETAKNEGWQLVTFFDDNGRGPPQLMVAAAPGPRFINDRAARDFVIERARTHSAIHQHALRLVMNSRIPTKG